jgi:hypothetical protein
VTVTYSPGTDERKLLLSGRIHDIANEPAKLRDRTGRKLTNN